MHPGLDRRILFCLLLFCCTLSACELLVIHHLPGGSLVTSPPQSRLCRASFPLSINGEGEGLMMALCANDSRPCTVALSGLSSQASIWIFESTLMSSIFRMRRSWPSPCQMTDLLSNSGLMGTIGCQNVRTHSRSARRNVPFLPFVFQFPHR